MTPGALTFDLDWAPDLAIDYVANVLRARGVRATFFVTHRSAAVERLRATPELFELGVHPNFMPGSTHGATPAAVLAHCLELVPEARSMRTHGLIQSSALLDTVLATTPLTVECSLFMPRATHLASFRYERPAGTMVRVPYAWEDDYELEHPEPRRDMGVLLGVAGLRIFDFHPIHVFLNSCTFHRYQELKRQVPHLFQASEAELAGYVQAGEGTRTAFLELVDLLAEQGSARLMDLV